MEVLNISQDDDLSDTSQEEDIDVDDLDSCSITESKVPSFVHWQRPPLSESLGQQSLDDIEFMVTQSDFGLLSKSVSAQETIDAFSPLVNRLYGVTLGGHSVCCHVLNYLPYFYALPISGTDFLESHIQSLTDKLNDAIRNQIMNELKSVSFHDYLQITDPVFSIELIENQEEKDKTRGIFDLVNLISDSLTKNTKVLKITCRLPRFSWTAGKLLGKGGIRLVINDQEVYFETYETNINHNIRFLTDQNIPGCSWVRAPAGKYVARRADQKSSEAQLEFELECKALEKFSERRCVPPLRVLSFDLEVMTRPPLYTFPRGGAEEILMVGNTVALYSRGEAGTNDTLAQSIDQVVFTLKSCDPIPGAHVYAFETEIEMLEAWRRFLMTFDPDIVIGYNIKRFDFPYLLARASRLSLGNKIPFLGRLKHIPCRLRSIKNASKAIDAYDTERMNLNGRVLLDVFLLIKRHNSIPAYSKTKRGQYTLGEVAKRYLQESKGDVEYHKIYELHESGSEGRQRLAVYCLQDTALPYKLLLLRHFPSSTNPLWDMLQFYVHKARETGVPLGYLVNKSLDYHNYYKRIRQVKNPQVVYSTPVKRIAAVEHQHVSKCKIRLFDDKNKTEKD